MNTRQLAYFTTLVELKSFTKVAQEFHVSQPTITAAIKHLEEEFGADLVVHTGPHKPLTVTRAGKLLYARAQQVQKNLDLAKVEVNRANESTIRFSMPPIIGTMWFPLIAGQLFKQGLLRYMQTVEVGSEQLLKEIETGHIDIALLGSVRPLHDADLDTTLLASSNFEAIVSEKHPLAKAGHISFEQLKDENFVTFNQYFVHPQALAAYSQYAGFEPHVIYSTPVLSLIKALVKENFGVGLLVHDAIDAHDGIVGLTLDDPVAEKFNISLAIHKAYLPNPVQQRFIDTLSGLAEAIAAEQEK